LSFAPDGIDVKSERVPTKASIQQYQVTLTLTGIDSSGSAKSPPKCTRCVNRRLQAQGRVMRDAFEVEAGQDRQ
jgi:hypothetical protein